MDKLIRFKLLFTFASYVSVTSTEKKEETTCPVNTYVLLFQKDVSADNMASTVKQLRLLAVAAPVSAPNTTLLIQVL
jgi:hypothetical protein